MTDKELKKLKRIELLQMMISLSEENETLKAQLKRAQDELDNRQIQLREAGSIAEAALKLNGVFDAAEEAAQQYVASVRQMSKQQEAILRRAEQEAKIKSDAIIAEADAYSKNKHAEADAYWSKVLGKVQALLRDKSDLLDLLKSQERKTGNEA